MILGSVSRRGVARAVFVSDPGYMLRSRNVVDRFTILAPRIAAFGPILEFAMDRTVCLNVGSNCARNRGGDCVKKM
jgi:hypothetical protein